VGCAFGHYAHVLVDVDISQRLYEEIMVDRERERYAFYVEVVYKRLPDYCTHCQTIGHSVNGCNKLHPQFKSNPKSKLLKKGVSTKQ
jgi:hypothetical protein